MTEVGRELDICIVRRECGRSSDSEYSAGGGGSLSELGKSSEGWLVKGDVSEPHLIGLVVPQLAAGIQDTMMSPYNSAQVNHGPER